MVLIDEGSAGEIRKLVEWLTDYPCTGVVCKAEVVDDTMPRTIYLAYQEFETFQCVRGGDGLWSVVGSGPVSDGLTWLELNSKQLDWSYDRLAAEILHMPDLKMHCEVLVYVEKQDLRLRRFSSAVGLIRVSQKPLPPDDALYQSADGEGQFEVIWELVDMGRYFRVVGIDRSWGISVKQVVEFAPQGPSGESA